MSWWKKRMKKRFGLIHNWLKEAEKDYQEDRKTEGELNLLLAQAEVRRAWELSCQEEEGEAPKKPLPRKTFFSWQSMVVYPLGASLLIFLAFHFTLPKDPSTLPSAELPARSGQNLLITEEEHKLANPPRASQEEEKEVIKAENQAVKGKEEAQQSLPLKKTTKIEEVKSQPVTQEIVKPIQVDMVDLVQEAERVLYQSNGR